MKNNKNKLNPHFFRKMSNGLDIALMFYKTRLNPQQTQKGNTLLIGLGFGLLVMLLGGLAIAKANNNKINATSNEKTAQAQAVTDIGVTRTLAFLNQNPKLAEYPLAEWAAQAGSLSSGGEGTSVNNTGDSATCGTITGTSTTTTSTTTTQVSTLQDGESVVPNANTATEWKRGAFKLESYIPTNLNFVQQTQAEMTALSSNTSVNAGDTYGYGEMTIRGQINPDTNSTSNTGTDLFANNDANSSIGKMKVNVELRKSDPNSIPFPGLWIQDQQNAGPKSQVDGNLLVPDCDNLDELKITDGNSVTLSSVTMPSLPAVPTVAFDNGTNNTYYYNLGSSFSGNLPREGDLPIGTESREGSDGTVYTVNVYRYSVTDLSGLTTIIPGRKVIIDVLGNVSASGSSGITNQCKNGTGYSCNATTKVVTYSGTGVTGGVKSLFKKDDLILYGRATSGGTLCINGTPEIQGFLFLPEYTAGVSGSGGLDGFYGVLWVKSFETGGGCGSNTSQIVMKQDMSITWGSTGLAPQNMPPTLGSVAKKERQSVN